MTPVAILVLAAAGAIFAPGDGPVEPPAPAPDATTLERGAAGADVETLQRSLLAAGFRPGPVDGEFGRRTYQAVLAFQKHHGLERDGVFRAEHWELVRRRPTVRLRSEADRVEIDLGRQVLYLVRDNQVESVLPVSSGNGELFENYAGNVVRARTPEGRFAFYFQRNYYHTSYLGAMYKPYYFRGGYAIHGSPSVPPWPASHGCVRVTNADMDYLRQHLSIGQTLYVYGLRTENPKGMTSRPALAATAA